LLVDALAAAARAVSFIALFQAAGMAIFLALFGRALSASAIALRRYGMISALVAAAAVLAHYCLEPARMAGDLAGVGDASLHALVLQSSTGVAIAWRLPGLLLIAIGLRSTAGAAAPALSVIGATLVIASFALTGHTASHPERWLLSVLLVMHLIAAAFWFGSLIPLHVASSREPVPIAARIIEEFSALAIRVVPLLFVAGLILAAVLLGGLAGLALPYGRMLLVKLAGFAVLMVLAALNKWRLGPAVGSGDARAAASFRNSLRAEYVLIAAVLSVTAIMTTFFSPEQN
jgi:putative copper resistance protein D